MNHQTTCKFCKKPITVQVDDAYAELGDVFKLLTLACCNRCADLRVKRRNLEDGIKKIVNPLIAKFGNASVEESNMARAALVTLTKKYTAMVADWLHSTTPWWDVTIVDSIMEKPDKWTLFIEQCWKMYETNKP